MRLELAVILAITGHTTRGRVLQACNSARCATQGPTRGYWGLHRRLCVPSAAQGHRPRRYGRAIHQHVPSAALGHTRQRSEQTRMQRVSSALRAPTRQGCKWADRRHVLGVARGSTPQQWERALLGPALGARLAATLARAGPIHLASVFYAVEGRTPLQWGRLRQ